MDASTFNARLEAFHKAPSSGIGPVFLESVLQGVFIHEAGHAVVALLLGQPRAGIQVKFFPKAFPRFPFSGKCITNRKRTKFQNAVIGYAGVVAEMIAKHGDVTPEFVDSLLTEGDYEPSKSDWRCIRSLHPSWNLRAVRKCIALLMENWTYLQNVVGHLSFDYEWRGDRADIICFLETIKITSPALEVA